MNPAPGPGGRLPLERPAVEGLVAFLSLPKEGETENGDAAMVRRFDDGAAGGALIAVIDALGHGQHAAAAAEVALSYLNEAPVTRGLRVIVEELHDRLRGTRGAAAMLLLVRDQKLEGCGVGNVALRSYRGRVPATLTPGILGSGGPLKLLRVFQAEVSPGDRLVVHSDGIDGRFDDEVSRRALPQDTCQAIMKRHRRPHDDATVLVADFAIPPVRSAG